MQRQAVRWLKNAVGDLVRQWRWSLRNAALSALAAGIAWRMAGAFTGDPKPVSAAVTAVVALAPGIANPRVQLAGFITGFCTGLIIGAVARPLIDAEPTLMMAPVAFVAIVAASSFGRNPITLIQSGATALLVVGSGTTATAAIQFKEALVGAVVASALSQVFFSPDPVPMLEQAAARLADRSADLLASENGRAGPAWETVVAASAEFEQAAGIAFGVKRWTVRGRRRAKRISAAEALWLTPVRRLSAAAALASVSNAEPVWAELRSALAAVRALPRT